jgi:hypothetical protein
MSTKSMTLTMVRATDRGLSLIANRRTFALAVVGLVAFFSSSVPFLLYSRSVTPFSSWSFLTAYDEFSYLLAADTYASGRLTNPTHEMWRHFETLSVNHLPTYQSMYQPGQGMFLAFGQVLTGHPIVGVWISMALACTAICYMLQAWFPPRWALLGGLLAALHARMALEWGGTYWGGGVTMLGGALTFGGLRHILNRPRAFDSLLLALGLVVLANTRPFEGLAASAPALVVLLGWLLVDGKSPLRTRIARVVAPIVAVLAVAAAGMAYYNYRVTENPWTLPYQVYWAAHDSEAPFVWQRHENGPGIAPSSPGENGAPQAAGSEAEPLDNLEPLWSDDEEWWFSVAYLKWLSHPSLMVAALAKLAIQWAFYIGPVLSVPLLALLWGRGDRWTWFALTTCGLTLAAVFMTSGAWPHYLAPGAPMVFVLVVQGARYLGPWRRRGRRIGTCLGTTLLLLCVMYWILLVAAFPQVMKELRWTDSRTQLRAQLEQMDGDHLVIVRYRPGHTWYKEWVYNRADIDSARVVWARELSPDSNRQLMDYFKDRQVWLVEADRDPPTLVPFEPELRSMEAPPSQ